MTIILLAAAAAPVVFLMRPGAVPVSVRTPAPQVSATPQPPERSVVGTLDQIDAKTLQLVVNTPSGRQTFHLQPGATIRQGSKTIKPSDLPAHKGERVKVRYRESSGVRRAEWLVFAAPPARKSPQPATVKHLSAVHGSDP